MANVGNRGRFHLNGDSLREVVTDFAADGAIDEGITAHNQAAYGVEVQLSNALFCRRNQLIVGLKAAGQPEADRIRSRMR